ncbi:MAG: hypothetical protein IH802_12130, partial [Nitrospinae bacterium]|nr:hypothetical protein [Nitrospinota bacterium]
MTATKGKASSRAKTTIKTKVTASDPKEISIKTRNKANTEFCNQCQGSLYVLTNVAGRVHGELCACFQCPECQGRGHIYIEDATGISSLRECVCAELVHSLKKINKAGIPGKFLGATFESFNPKHDSQKIALRYSRDFVNDYNEGGIKGLLFMGRPGVG